MARQINRSLELIPDSLNEIKEALEEKEVTVSGDIKVSDVSEKIQEIQVGTPPLKHAFLAMYYPLNTDITIKFADNTTFTKTHVQSSMSTYYFDYIKPTYCPAGEANFTITCVTNNKTYTGSYPFEADKFYTFVAPTYQDFSKSCLFNVCQTNMGTGETSAFPLPYDFF